MPDDPQDRRGLMMDRMTAARQAGASWDQIHQSLATRVDTARKAGATEQQIQQSLGFNNPEELIEATQHETEQHMAATKPESWVGSFVNGLTHSSSAALLGVKPDETQPETHGKRLTASVGETIGDIPAMIAGGIGGAVAGAETGPGAIFTGAAGTMALPQLIKSERDRYANALQNGQVKGPEDYLRIQADVAKDTAEAAAVGVVTAGAGKVAGPVLDKMGANKVTKFIGTVGAEGTAMVTAQAALAGHMPHMEDFIDAAITIGAFHTAVKIAPSGYRAIRQRLSDNYVETGELPRDAADRAVHDPVFRAQMLGQPNPKVPPGSSHTYAALPELPQRGIVSGPHSPLPPDTYIVPRVTGDFDHALAWMFKEEGGLTTDTGGVTKYGISAKAHPGLDIAHISKDDAAEIYHREYWRAIDADALPPNMRLAAFDSAVNQGVPQTKTWLKEAGGDLQKFIQLRMQDYARLARDPKYAKYAPAWAKRLKDLGASDAMAGIIQRGPENVGRDFTDEDKQLLALSEEGGQPPEPPERGPTEPPEDEDPWKHVMSRVAPDEGTDWLGGTIEGFSRIYGELFDPSHPIRKLVDGATKGDPLDDYHNPELLFRLAENSGTVAQWAIKKQMVDLDGNVTGPSLEDIASGKSVGAKFSNADTKKFLDGYAMSKWAVMMAEQGKETGIDLDKAKAVIADGSDKYEKSFQQLVGYRNQTLKWLGDGGVHAKDKVDKLIEDNQSTIPGYRRMDDGSYQPASSGKPGIWNPIKTAKGSQRLVEPILKSLMQETFLRHEIAWNNRAMTALADLGLKGGEASEKRAVDINIISAMDDLKEQGIDDDMVSALAKSAGRTLPKDQVPLFRDGKLYGVKFNDPELTQYLRGFDSQGFRTTMKVIGAVTSIPRNFQTRYNPLFPVKLLTYDLPFQYIVNPDSKGPFSNFFLGLGEFTSDPEGYAKWARSGGAERVFDTVNKDAFIRSSLKGFEDHSLAYNMWNAATSPFKALTAWTRMVSTPLRLGRYAKGLAEGDSSIRAAVGSSEAAFHRPGYGGPVGKAWNTIVPYTTAHLNGLEKTFRALLGQTIPKALGKTNRTVTGVEYNAARTWARGIAMLTAPAIATWFFYKDQEWYKAMPDWQKNNSLLVIPPIGNLPPIPIPAPPILSFFFVALPRMLIEKYVEDNPHAADDIWKTLGASLMPPGALVGASVLTPVIEHYANYSFHRGQPLVNPDTVRGVQPAEQFTPYTSRGARDLAQFASDLPLVHSDLGWSPAIADNYIAQWGGPMGRAAVQASAALLDHPTNPPVEQKVSEWPGISAWVARYPSASAAPIQQFYDTTTKLTQEHGSLQKEIRENNFAAFKRIVDRGGPSAAAWQRLSLGQNIPPGVDLSPYFDYLDQAAQGADQQNLGLAHQADNALKNARQHSWQIYENQNLSGHDKRQQLDMVNAQMQVIAERGNEAMDRALIGVKRAGRSANVPIPDSISFAPPEEVQ